MSIHPVDSLIVVVYLLGMIAIGWAVARRVRGFADFFVAGRALTVPILICTLVSSYYGLDALFGDSGDASREGVVVWFTYGRPYTLALLLAAFLIARRLRGLQVLSIPDLLALHYGRPTQVAGAIASFLYSLPILAIMGLAAMAEVMFGAPLWLGATVGAAVSVAYVAMGGFWADTLTDTVQFLIMCVSLAVALPFILDAAGGFDGIAAALGPEALDPLGSAPPLYTIAYAATALSVLVEPLFYQRIVAARDDAVVRRAFLWGIVLWAAYDWATMAVGMAGGAMMATGALPADTPRDQVLMRLVPAYLPLGLSGFFIGGCLATAMSTIDSYLLIAAGNLVYDVYRPVAAPDMEDKALVRGTRLAMVLSAAACVVIGLYFERIKEAWNFMATVLTATLLVPVLAALFLPGRRAPLAGALSSFGGLGAVAAFFAALHVWGVPEPELETRVATVAGVAVLREYALFVALPVSLLGYVVGAWRGRCP
ncbi:MAG TPA: sodium:solute symporter family protein [Candidatus Tectomicrobia bacterium]|nr:sodium:solute symporter family protein [Candidatus Tectomicrobia bacterium]